MEQNVKTKRTLDLGFFTDENLFDFFCRNKTMISTIEEPLMFLRHLRDNKLITDDIFHEDNVNVSGVYHVLEYIEKRGKKKIRRFWNCVKKDHILQLHPKLSEIINALESQLKGSNETISDRMEDRGTGKQREVSKRRTVSFSDRDQAGPSSRSTSNQRTTEKNVETALPSPSLRLNSKTRKKSNEQDAEREKAVKRIRTESYSLNNHVGPSSQSTNSHIKETVAEKVWDNPKHKRWLPVTCGKGEQEKKAMLDRDALYNRKTDCIKYRGNMISPYVFEEMGGKGSSKSWKTSILCQGTTLQSLIDIGILKIPKVEGKFTLRK